MPQTRLLTDGGGQHVDMFKDAQPRALPNTRDGNPRRPDCQVSGGNLTAGGTTNVTSTETLGLDKTVLVDRLGQLPLQLQRWVWGLYVQYPNTRARFHPGCPSRRAACICDVIRLRSHAQLHPSQSFILEPQASLLCMLAVRSERYV